MTLVHQGGPMTEAEAKEFEKHPQFESILKMRTWDEKAKVQNMQIEPLDKYKTMLQEYLTKQ